MPNDIKVLSFITNEMLRQVKNNLQFVRNCSGEMLQGKFTDSPKKGETIKIRKRARFVGRDGETFTEEDYVERTVDVTVQTTAGVDLLLTNRELMFSLDNIAEKVVKPAAETLANKIDRAALRIAVAAVANSVGVVATVPTTLKLYNQARALMVNEGAPMDSHALLITPDMNVEAVDAGKSLFHGVDSQYESGVVGRHAGAKVYECQNLIALTTGAYGGTPAVDGANQIGSTLNTKAWTAAAAPRVRIGDVLTLAGVYAVNPWTRESTGGLRKFVVTADKSSDGAGLAALTISPAIVTTGAYQNVTGSPADGALISIYEQAAAQQGAIASKSSPQGLRFHKEAFLFGSLNQPNPGSAVTFTKEVTDEQTGITIRYIRDWDTKANKQIDRFDVVWYFGVAFPEFAARLIS